MKGGDAAVGIQDRGMTRFEAPLLGVPRGNWPAKHLEVTD